MATEIKTNDNFLKTECVTTTSIKDVARAPGRYMFPSGTLDMLDEQFFQNIGILAMEALFYRHLTETGVFKEFDATKEFRWLTGLDLIAAKLAMAYYRSYRSDRFPYA